MTIMTQRLALLALFLLSCVLTSLQAFQLSPRTPATWTRATRGTLEMKGKGSRVPIDQRGEFIKRQRMIEQREAMTNPTTTTPGTLHSIFMCIPPCCSCRPYLTVYSLQ